ncbi:ephrin-A1-like [Narcine bancroftii]|uniref:ephrin-A1-like n=1 Tax=Narcine bancroftii TaxID=1343680 RepID=UPI0038313D5B
MHGAILLILLMWINRTGAERFTVYWNRSNPTLRDEDFTLDVRLNDYLDILCPHYGGKDLPALVEEYTLYLVDKEGYQLCQVHPSDEVRWQCRNPSAPHGPERFSEKFQRFTPFSLGKEFHKGKSYHYISKAIHSERESCLKLRVHVLTSHKRKIQKESYTTKAQLSADQPPEQMPDTQRSTGGAPALMASPVLATLLSLLLLAML